MYVFRLNFFYFKLSSDYSKKMRQKLLAHLNIIILDMILNYFWILISATILGLDPTLVTDLT